MEVEEPGVLRRLQRTSAPTAAAMAANAKIAWFVLWLSQAERSAFPFHRPTAAQGFPHLEHPKLAVAVRTPTHRLLRPTATRRSGEGQHVRLLHVVRGPIHVARIGHRRFPEEQYEHGD